MSYLDIVLEVINEKAHLRPEFPDLAKLLPPLPVLHEEGPAVVQGSLCATQFQQHMEQGIVPTHTHQQTALEIQCCLSHGT